MRIVQSLWSKPSGKKGVPFSAINKCGWPEKKFNYISWALSCLQFRKYYDQVELVTDNKGYELLIEKMQLPYTSVRVVLDELNSYDKDLYALGKIYAYQLQQEPFIHADGDVYIWDRFDHELERASLICQNVEDGEDYNRWYAGMFLQVAENLEFYPETLDRSISRNNRIVAVNAGILGGRDMDFFKSYTQQAFDFVERNTRLLPKIDIKLFNLIFEQFLFHALAEDRTIPVTFYNPDFVRFWNDISDFVRIPSRTKYIHTMGVLKRSKYTVDALEYRLRTHHPDYYYKLIGLLRSNQI